MKHRRRIAHLGCLLALGLPGIAQAAQTHASKTCDVHAYGAKGDGITKDTHAIQAAIDDCAKSGGGTVLLAKAPAFLTAPLILHSNITLDIAPGTTLKGSTDHDDYPTITEFRQPARQALLSSERAENITIRGGGTIDGQGQSWWPDARNHPEYLRPRLIVFSHSKHVLMENVTAQNAAFWQIVAYYSDDLTFRNMTVLAPERAPNTDGIDPFSSSHILIEHVRIDTGDDNVAIKSGQPNSPGPDAPSHDIVVRDCIFQHGHGLSVGSEVAGGVQHLLAERIAFTGTDNGIRVKSNRDRGADISDLVYRDITMRDVKIPILITMFYPTIPDTIDPAPLTRLTPHFHDISLTSVHATGGIDTVVVVGLPESPIANLNLTNITVSGQKSATLQYANVHATNLTIHPTSGQPIKLGADVTGNLKQ